MSLLSSRARAAAARPRDWAGLGRQVATAYVLIFGLTLLFYGAAWPDAPVLDGDSAQYMEVARDLADGRLDELHLRTPGYPLLLALTGAQDGPTRALFWVSLGLHLASIWMLGAVLRAAGGSDALVLVLAVLLVLPLYVEPAAYVMTENLAQFALVSALACLVRWHARGGIGWAFVAGVALSFAAVVRPVYQLLAPVFCVVVLAIPFLLKGTARPRLESVRGAVAIALAWVGIVVGLAAFNYAQFQWFGMAPSAGFHLSTRTAPLFDRLPEEYAGVREILVRERDAQLVTRGGTHTGTQAIWSVRDELAEVTRLTQPELSQYLVRMNLVLIRRAPLEYLQEAAKSFVPYWFPAWTRLAALDSSVLRWIWTLLHFLIVGALAWQVCSWIGVKTFWWLQGRREPLFEDRQGFVLLIALTIVFYTMLLCCFVDIGEPRQRRSTDALIVLSTLVGLSVWRRWSRERPEPT